MSAQIFMFSLDLLRVGWGGVGWGGVGLGGVGWGGGWVGWARVG